MYSKGHNKKWRVCVSLFCAAACVCGPAPLPAGESVSALLPQSEFTKDEKKGKSYFDLAKSLQLALDIYRELKGGKTLREIRVRHAGDPAWSRSFDHMIFLDKTLLIPMGSQRYLMISQTGWEEIGIDAARKLIDTLSAYQTGTVSQPLGAVSPDSIKNIIVNTMPVWDRGDYIIQSTLFRILLKHYPGSRLFVVNKYPDIWEGVARVTAVRHRKELGMQPDDFDLVIDLDHEGLADNWLYEGRRNKILKMEKFSNSCRYIDNAARTDQAVEGAPLEWDIDFNYNFYDYYLRLAESWGLPPPDEKRPLIAVKPQEIEAVSELVKETGIPLRGAARPYVVLVNPFSRKEEKELSAQEWIMLVKSILWRIPQKGVVLIERGTLPRHQRMAEDMESLLRMSGDIDRRRVQFVPKQIGYRELMALVSLSDLVVGPDTSTAHIAAALDRDAVTIFVQRPGGETLYFPPLEWSVFTPRIFNVEIVRRPDDHSAGASARAPIDLKPIESALESVMLLKNRSFGDFFVNNDIPGAEVRAMEAFFTAVSHLARAGDFERAGHAWMSKDGYSLFKRFVAELRPPYDFFFLSDIFTLNLFARDPLMLPGFSGFLQTSNLYKFVSALAAQLREEGRASGVIRFDVNGDIETEAAAARGA